MSVNAVVRLNGSITSEEILSYLKQKVDPKAISRVEKTIVTDLYIDSGFMFFEQNGNPLSLYYYHTSRNLKENYEYWVDKGLEDMVNTHTTELRMDSSPQGIQILNLLVKEYGGWIDENDSDERYFEPVIKNPDGTIKPVFHVSMEDIYEIFGGVVIIDKHRASENDNNDNHFVTFLRKELNAIRQSYGLEQLK